jgi:hypothetical protein
MDAIADPQTGLDTPAAGDTEAAASEAEEEQRGEGDHPT